jgi:hypothetical protein
MTDESKDMLILLFWGAIAILGFTFIPNAHPPKVETYYESHTVKPGETLSEIVQQYHGSLKSTLAEHPSSWVMPGEKIRVVVER